MGRKNYFEEVSFALLNYEIWKKDQREHYQDESVEALIVRGRSQNMKW